MPSTSVQASQPHPAKKRILLAEDDRPVLTMTKLRLEHEGFEVIVAMDGQEALAQVQAVKGIDLILMDVKMPKLNGLQVCERLKAQPATAKIPVIIFTATLSQWQHITDQCLELGVTDWLKKPFRSEDLIQRIYRALGEEGTTHV